MMRVLRRSPYDREIRRLALPALGALAVDPLVSLVDTAYVGHLGAAALAAVAIAAAVFAVVFAIFNFLEYAVTPFVAQAVGAGDRSEAGRVTVAALGVAVVAGIIATVILVIWGSDAFGVFGAEPDVRLSATTYLRIRALAMPAVLIVMVGHGAFRGYQDTRTPLLVTVLLNVVNLVLDPLLIFAAGWGVAGAAWATVIAQWVGALLFLLLFLVVRRRDLGISFGRPQRRAVGSLLGAGRSLILRNASLLAALTAATVVAARIGTDAVAAHQIAMQLWIFLALVVDAVAIAGQAMVGRSMGRSDVSTAREVAHRLIVLGVGFGFALGGALIIAGQWLPRLFTDSSDVLAALALIYPFLVVMQPINAYVFVWDGIAIGTSSFPFLAVSTLGSALIAIALLALVIPLGLGLPAVWFAVVALMLGRAGSFVWWSRTGPLAA